MTFISSIAIKKAQSKPKWRNFAMISLEMSHSCNMVITLIYWIVLSPTINKGFHVNTFWDIYLFIFINGLHVTPIIASTLNIYYSDLLDSLRTSVSQSVTPTISSHLREHFFMAKRQEMDALQMQAQAQSEAEASNADFLL